MAQVQVSVQKIDINPVVDIIVTPIIQDAAGNYIRGIRFYGKGDTNENELVLLLEVLARAAAPSDIDIAVPATTF